MTDPQQARQLTLTRVLLLTQWFDPEPTFKGLQFARSLQDRGFTVDVLTGFPNYPGGRLYPGFRVKLFQREVIEGIRVLRVPLFPSHDRSSLRRALNYMSFAASAAVACLFIRRPDVAYIYHPPATVAVAARILKAVRRVPYVYDVQDLWPDTLASTGMMTRPVLIRAVTSLVRWAYRGASRVVVLSHGFKSALLTRGVPDSKVEVIHNWTYESSPSMPELPSTNTGSFTVVYAGNVGAVQALDVVLDAALLLVDEPVRFHVVGDGLDLTRLRNRAHELALENVVFVSRQPPTAMSGIYRSASALLVHLQDDPLFAITVPSKTQAYLMAGRPILMGVRGDAARIVQDAGCGLPFEPESAPDLARAVRELIALGPAENERLGKAGREYYRRHLALDIGVDRFAELFRLFGSMKVPRVVVKRMLDFVLACVGLLVLAVPIAVIAGVLRVSLKGPAFFRQERPGRDGVPFTLVKFRTMTDLRGPNGTLLPDRERLTRIGRFLRSTSLDELPELWNVLRGDMSVVGPRPLLMRYTPHFTETESLRLVVRPGITGWAQVNGRNLTSWDDRLKLDVWYVQNHSLFLDARILFRTVSAVFGARGVLIDPEAFMQNLDDERMSRRSS